MKKIAFILIAMIVTLAGPLGPAAAEERGTREQAKAMAEKAGQFLAANGPEKAYAAFDDGTNGFKDKDLYVFAYDDAGNCVAHGANRALIGKTLLGIKDVDGKALVAEIVAVKSAGWVDYKWKNPQTGSVDPKHAYIVRIKDIVVGVGAYGQ